MTKVANKTSKLHSRSPKPGRRRFRRPKLNRTQAIFLAIVAAALITALGVQIQQIHAAGGLSAYTHSRQRAQLRSQYNQLLSQIKTLEDKQSSNHLSVIDQATLQAEISKLSLDFAETKLADAKLDLAKLNQDVNNWQKQLDQALADRDKPKPATASAQTAVISSNDLQVPILLYHYTPADFESQLKTIRSRGYTTISLDQLAQSLTNSHQKLPTKSVVITFDDGYSDQVQAWHLLDQYQMKATFYIIIFRADSGCPSATTDKCDPLYLSWDQIKQIDGDPLMTIGDHTINHPALATLPADQQQNEILGAKQILERNLGHAIRHFCYPYGSFNNTTINLVRQDGFETATTTIPGTIQTPGTIYTLRRIRSAYDLP